MLPTNLPFTVPLKKTKILRARTVKSNILGD
ncbi:Uncharacterised protein [Mycobacteroides abscessus subsp. bolletii]|nr:Uncharacterised protein [Mycobacteroides abscessus subsp. bolletii]